MISRLRGLVLRLRTGKATQAAVWSAAGQLASYVIRLGSTLVLTRLLTPADYGVLAIVFAIGIVLELLSDVGIRACIIRSESGDAPDFLDTAWTIQVMRGVGMSLLTVLVGGALAAAQRYQWLPVPADSALASPLLPWLVIASAAMPVVLGVLPTKTYTANRQLLMSRIIVIDLITQISAVAMTIGVALLTRSAWAAVAGSSFACFVRVAFSHFWIPGRANRWHLNPVAMQELLSFGRWVLVSSSLTALALNGDKFLLGYWFDAGTIGQYAIAMTLVTLVPSFTARVVGAVAFPRISQALRESHQEFQRTVGVARRMYDLISMSTSGVLFACGPLAVGLLYDTRYESAGWMLSILSCSLILAREEFYKNIYLALGRTDVLPYFSGLSLASLIFVVPLAYQLNGLHGAIWALALRHAIALPLHYYFMHKNDLLRLSDDALAVCYWCAGAALGQLLMTLTR